MKRYRLATRLALILGAILWNSWVLGWLNHGSAGYLHMSISELEIHGQPSAWLFHVSEYLSGLLLIIGGAGIFVAKARRLHFLPVVAVAIILLGGLTVFDTTHPLDCTQYHDPVCVALTRAGRISHTASLHITESNITAFVTLFLALATIAWAVTANWHRSELLLSVGLLIGIAAGLLILRHGSDNTAGAIAERVWNTLVSVNIIFVAFKMTARPARHARPSG